MRHRSQAGGSHLSWRGACSGESGPPFLGVCLCVFLFFLHECNGVGTAKNRRRSLSVPSPSTQYVTFTVTGSALVSLYNKASRPHIYKGALRAISRRALRMYTRVGDLPPRPCFSRLANILQGEATMGAVMYIYPDQLEWASRRDEEDKHRYIHPPPHLPRLSKEQCPADSERTPNSLPLPH